MSLIVVGGILIAGSAVGYLLGIFDRPTFQYQESLVLGNDKNDKQQTYLYGILAFSTEKKIGQHIERILLGVRKGILEQPNGQAMMTAASKLYGPPADADNGCIALSLYFDDPGKKEHPRWLAGYAVQADTFEEIEKIVSDVQAQSGLTKEIVRAVRVGCGSTVLKASIPYRTMLTPMIAPMIHWTRAFHAYEKGNCKAACGRSNEEMESPGLELYFGSSAKKGNMNALEYVVVMGDTKVTWDDAIPLQSDPDSTTAATQ